MILQRRIAVFVFTLLLSSFCHGAGSAADTEQTLTLQAVTGNLYRFTKADAGAGDASGVLLVGSKGVAVGDPLDLSTATELNELIKHTFDLPVLYVFYSHASAARAAGAALFIENGATLVAHANSVHSAAVLDGLVPAPALVFEDTLTLNLSDSWAEDQRETLQLRYLGKSLTDDMIIAHFPQYGAVFTSGLVEVESLPVLPLDNAFIPQWFATIDKMNRIKYSYLLPGQGKIGIRSDAVEHGRYLRELHNRVARRVKLGQQLEQIVAEINLRRFKHWHHFEQALEDNVRSMFKLITSNTE